MQSSMKRRASSHRVYPTAVGFRHVGSKSRGLQELWWKQAEDAGCPREGGFCPGRQGICPGRQGFSLRSDDGWADVTGGHGLDKGTFGRRYGLSKGMENLGEVAQHTAETIMGIWLEAGLLRQTRVAGTQWAFFMPHKRVCILSCRKWEVF